MKAITVLDCVKAKLNLPDDVESISMEQVEGAGFPFFCGCQGCEASMGCYNAHPTRTGYTRCAECVGVSGFASVEEYNAWEEGKRTERERADVAWEMTRVELEQQAHMEQMGRDFNERDAALEVLIGVVGMAIESKDQGAARMRFYLLMLEAARDAYNKAKG